MPTIKLHAHLSALVPSSPFIIDAPKDDNTYGRKNGDWVEIDYSDTNKIKPQITDTLKLSLNDENELEGYVLKIPNNFIIEQSDNSNQVQFDGSQEIIFKLPLASTEKAGEVKKAIAIEDSNAITLEALVKDYNKLLQILRDAGIIDTKIDHYNYITYDGEHLVAYDNDASKLIVY